MAAKTLYKFLRTGLKSNSGDCTWEIGSWKKQEGKPKLCNQGFHASKTPLQALGYVKGEILAEVEVRGDSDIGDDKECWSEMRIKKAWHWEKTDSVELAIFAAELVIDIFEKKYPNDDRPRKAILSAKEFLKNPSRQNAAYAVAAADAAYAAYIAADAADAADSAANAANAAYAAYVAAYAAYAVYAAYIAAYAADSAANAANAAASRKSQIKSKIDKWFLKKIKTLKEI